MSDDNVVFSVLNIVSEFSVFKLEQGAKNVNSGTDMEF